MEQAIRNAGMVIVLMAGVVIMVSLALVAFSLAVDSLRHLVCDLYRWLKGNRP